MELSTHTFFQQITFSSPCSQPVDYLKQVCIRWLATMSSNLQILSQRTLPVKKRLSYRIPNPLNQLNRLVTISNCRYHQLHCQPALQHRHQWVYQPYAQLISNQTSSTVQPDTLLMTNQTSRKVRRHYQMRVRVITTLVLPRHPQRRIFKQRYSYCRP